MSYAKNLLSRGEEVVFESRQHWFAILAQTWAFVIGALLAFAVLIWQTSGNEWAMRGFLQIVSLAVLLVSLAWIGLKVWAWRNQEYLVTTRRIIKAQGIFNKEMGDSSLEKVNDAHLTQSWLGRIFDYGTLDVLTAADESGSIQDYEMLAEPVKFKISMLNQKEKLERPDLAPPARMQSPASMPPMQRAEPMAPRAGTDRVAEVPMSQAPVADAAPVPAASAPAPASPGEQLAATLQSLATLVEKGLITPEEYETKKRDLLERM
ncbi:MAG: PH domain-containing protein [Chloroflexota bacterium]|nr:PH domain-containing protein [Chloroflexota bacterium]